MGWVGIEFGLGLGLRLRWAARQADVRFQVDNPQTATRAAAWGLSLRARLGLVLQLKTTRFSR